MNRALLIIAIPAFFVGAAYWLILRHLQIHPSYIRLAGAGAAFLAAVALVRHYRRSRPRRSGQ